MVVYLDVLIIVNILIDYFLLRLTGFIIKEKPKPFRILSASFLGGGLSLLILLPKLNGLLQIAFCIISCIILCGISFRFKPMKKFFRSFVILFCASNLFGGVIISLKLLRNPNGIYIKNSVVYFNISPLILIVSASVYYIGAVILKYTFEKNGKYSENCTVTAYLENSCITLKGIVDTGNSLTDMFGISEIIITDKKSLDGIIKNKDLSSRYRSIPIKTVMGSSLLDGYRFDKAEITTEKAKKKIDSPVFAISKENIDGDYNAIVSPRSLL